MADFRWEGATPDDIRWEGTSISELRYEGETVWPVDTGSSSGTVVDFEDMSLSAFNTVSGPSQFWQFTDSANEEPIGGGHFYDRKVTESDATVVVNNYSELTTELANAGDGDIVFMGSDIDMTNQNSPQIDNYGVTLASNRGVNGAPGAKLYAHDNRQHMSNNSTLLVQANNVRLTGFRFEGPSRTWSPESSGYDTVTDWQQHGVRNEGGANLEIDNCEMYGFGRTVINAGREPGFHCHHSHILRGTRDGVGYGIGYNGSSTSSNPGLVEYNIVSYCRHHISSRGYFTWRHNIVEEPHAGNPVQSHPSAADSVVHNNTIIASYHQHGEDSTSPPDYGTPDWANGPDYNSGYLHRDVPDTWVQVDDNWIWTQAPPEAGTYFASIAQHGVSSFTNMGFSGNTLGYDHARGGRSIGSEDGRAMKSGGDHALVCYNNRQACQIQSTSGLDRYPQAGDTFRFWFMVSDPKASWLAQLLFGVQDETMAAQYYELELEEGTCRLQVDRPNQTSDDTLGSTSIEWMRLTPYRITVDWPSDPANNGISIDIAEHIPDTTVASFTCTADNEFTSGGIGFFANNNPTVLFDDLVIL